MVWEIVSLPSEEEKNRDPFGGTQSVVSRIPQNIEGGILDNRFPDPNAPYGLRTDGTPKGRGFLGLIPMPDGRVASEKSIGVEFDGKETLIPSIVPTLSRDQLDRLLATPEDKQLPDDIVKTAADYARGRLDKGLSPFASKDEEATFIMPGSDFEIVSRPEQRKPVESILPPSAEYIVKSGKSGVESVLAAASNVLGAAYNNLFGISQEELDILAQSDPEFDADKWKKRTKYTPGRIAEEFAGRQFERSRETMQNLSDESIKRFAGRVYFTADPGKAAWSSPTRLVGDVLQSLPSTMALALSARFGGGAANQAYTRAISQGLSKEAARKAAIDAAARTVAVTGAVGEGLIGGSLEELSTHQEVMDLPLVTLQTSPLYKSLRDKGYDEDAARRIVALQASRAAGFIAGVTDAVTNMASGPFLGRTIGEGGPMLQRGFKGAATEAFQEGIQGPGENIGSGVAIREYADPNRNPYENLAEEALQGIFIGALTGGPISAVAGESVTGDETPGGGAVDQALDIPGVPQGAVNADILIGQDVQPGDAESPIPTAIIAEGRRKMRTGQVGREQADDSISGQRQVSGQNQPQRVEADVQGGGTQAPGANRILQEPSQAVTQAQPQPVAEGRGTQLLETKPETDSIIELMKWATTQERARQLDDNELRLMMRSTPASFEGIDTAIISREFNRRFDRGFSEPAAQPVTIGEPITRKAIRPDVAVTPQGAEVPVEYAIVDAADLITSEKDGGGRNPAYPAELQPRDRARGSSQQQIASIAQNLNPRLLAESPRIGDGAPVISPDGIVESGNGRTLAIRRAYSENLPGAEAYREYLAAQGYPVEGVKQPVLVRVRTSELDTAGRRQLAIEANERDTLGMSATERAQADASSLNTDILSLYRGGDIDAAANREFVKAFIEKAVGTNEQAGMVGPDGSLSQEAVRRVQGALLARAYSSDALTAEMLESQDTAIKAIGGALTDVSAAWAQMRAEAEAGAIDPSMDQTQALLEALGLVNRARREGQKVGDLVGQTDIFTGRGLSQPGEWFLRLFFRDTVNWAQPAGRQKIADALAFYVQEARKATPGVDLLGETAPAPEKIIALAKEKQYGGQQKDQGSIFEKPVLSVRQSDRPNRTEGTAQAVQGAARQGSGEAARTGEQRAAESDRAVAQTETPEFKTWWREGSAVIGDSKVVNYKGEPLVVYHGTQAREDFESFAVGENVSQEDDEFFRHGSGNDPRTFLGSHFADSQRVANIFARGVYGERQGTNFENGRVIPAYLKITNPYETSDSAMLDEMLRGNYNTDSVEYVLDKDGNIDQNGERYDADAEYRKEVNEEALRLEQVDAENGAGEFELPRMMAEQYRASLQEKGFDGIKYDNEVEGGVSYIVFEPRQVKSAIGNRGTFSPTDERIAFQFRTEEGATDAQGRPLQQTIIPGAERSAQQAAKAREGRIKPKAPQKEADQGLFESEAREQQLPLLQTRQREQIDTPEFRAWFDQSKITNEDGTPTVMYRGDFRDVGPKFKLGAATSARFYFTDDPAIASNYAESKVYIDEVTWSSYANWFTFKPPQGLRRRPNLIQQWYYLDSAQRDRVANVLLRAKLDDESRNMVFSEEEDGGLTSRDYWDFEVRNARGNWLQAANEIWLSSGAIFDDEAQFSTILKEAGLTDFEFDDPRVGHPVVTPVFLSVQNPLVTSAVPERLLDDLQGAVKGDRTRQREGGTFDKDSITPRQWVDEFKGDFEKKIGSDGGPVDMSDSYVWTSIPEKITKALQRLGYDGIDDRGGKAGPGGVLGEGGHRVVIAFEPTQIKSAIGNNGAFSREDKRIAFERREQFELELPQAEALKEKTIELEGGIQGAVSERFEAEREAMAGDLRDYLDSLNLKDVGARVYDRLTGKNEVGVNSVIDGFYFRGVVTAALDAPNKAVTFGHEAFHGLWRLGLFSKSEYNLLKAEARRHWTKDYADRLRDYDPQSNSFLEEANAFAYGDWVGGKSLRLSQPAKRLFQRVRDFLSRLGNVLRGRGFQTVEDIFERIDRGQTGARPRGQSTPGIAYSITSENGAQKRRDAINSAIPTQPLDRLMRIPFDVFGGINQFGQWEPGLYLWNKSPEAVTGGLYGAGAGAQVGAALGGAPGAVAGAAIGGAAGTGAGALLMARFSPEGRFAWMNGFLERARRGLIDRYGLSPEYLEVERARGIDQASIERKIPEILDSMKDLSQDEAVVLHRMLVGDDIGTAELDKLAQPIRESIAELGAELVELGFLEADSYQRNFGKYLHRVYLDSEADRNKGALSTWLRSRRDQRRARLVADQFKGRGMFQEVQPGRLMEFLDELAPPPQDGDKFIVLDLLEAEQGTLRDIDPGIHRKIKNRVFWPADKEVPEKYGDYTSRGTWEVRGKKGQNTILWRDFTKEERAQMGEIVDARYTIAKTYLMMGQNIATGRFYRDIALNEDWSTGTEPPAGKWKDSTEYQRFWDDANVEWVKVPDTKLEGTGVKRYGQLAGRYVRAEIWRDMQELDKLRTARFWNKALNQWKLNKTARNPVVHMNNVMSNVTLMDLADIRARDLVQAAKSMRAKDALYDEALSNGTFGADMMTQEIRKNVLEPILEEIETQVQGGTGNIESRMGAAGKLADIIWSRVKRLDAKMIDLYRAEDEVFRMAAFIRLREQGMDARTAGREARDQFLNYDIRAPWVNFARRSFLPFISYSYRATPIVAKAAITRPWKIAKYTTMAYAAMWLAYEMFPGDDDKEYASLRDEEKGYTWIGAPRFIRMPWGDQYGNPMFLDVRRWIPAGDVFDLNQGQGAIPLPAPLQFGGPIQMAFELMLNKQAFNGEPIYNEYTDDMWDRTANVSSWAYKSWAPSAPWIPGSWYWERIGNAMHGARDYAGRPYSVTAAVISSLGIKLRPQDVEAGFRIHARDFDIAERELRRQMSQARSDYDRGMISRATYDNRMQNIVDKIERVNEERRELGSVR